MSQYLAQLNIMVYNQLYSFSWGGGMVSPPVNFFQVRRMKKTNPIPLFTPDIIPLIVPYTFPLPLRRSVRGGHYAF